MANPDQVKELALEAMLDEDFREWLLDDPYSAAQSKGVTLTPGQKKFIKHLNRKDVDDLAKAYKKEKPDPAMGW